jgi:hypothetical protein
LIPELLAATGNICAGLRASIALAAIVAVGHEKLMQHRTTLVTFNKVDFRLLGSFDSENI